MKHEQECLVARLAGLSARAHGQSLASATHVGKATRRTANNIFQNRLFTPSFSPGFNGGNSFRCTCDKRPRLGTSSVLEPSGCGMYCRQTLPPGIYPVPSRPSSSPTWACFCGQTARRVVTHKGAETSRTRAFPSPSACARRALFAGHRATL